MKSKDRLLFVVSVTTATTMSLIVILLLFRGAYAVTQSSVVVLPMLTGLGFLLLLNCVLAAVWCGRRRRWGLLVLVILVPILAPLVGLVTKARPLR